MKRSWICRDYKSGDEYQILALFQKAFGKEIDIAFWRWRFAQNPSGKGIIKLLFDEKKLIGHYAVIPVNVQVEDKLVKAVLSMTTMTHPDYRGQGIFTYLAEETYGLCKKKGFLFVYGFPNKNSYYGFTSKLGWQGQGKMTLLQKELEPKAKKDLSTREVKQIEHFDNGIDSLWNKVKRNHTVIVQRTQEFLNWRFARNPNVDYRKYLISSNSGDIEGYIVLKIYVAGDMTIGHIVDILSVADEEVVKILLQHSYNYFLEQGVSYISCWIPRNSYYYGLLEKEGFTTKETETYFGIKILENDASLESVSQHSNWFLTMGDSDVF